MALPLPLARTPVAAEDEAHAMLPSPEVQLAGTLAPAPEQSEAHAPTPGVRWPFLLLCLALLLHAALGHLRAARAPRAALSDTAEEVACGVAAQLALYELGSACGEQHLEALLPLPRSRRACGSVQASLAQGSRAEWDAPFAMGGACALKWFTPAQACALLERVGTLVVVGDSLQRHLTQSLFAVLRGDYAAGTSLPPGQGIDAACLENCRCGAQFDDNGGDVGQTCSTGRCPREASAAFLGSAGGEAFSQSLACPAWQRAHVSFHSAVFKPSPAKARWEFDPELLRAELPQQLAAAAAEGERALARARARAPSQRAPGVTVLMAPPSSHLGYGEESRRVIADLFLAPVFEMLSEGGAGGSAAEDAVPRRVLCWGMSARQNNKPEYLATQGNQFVVPYNEWLKGACEGAAGNATRPGMLAGFVDPFAYTINHTSLDGVHYNQQVNIAMAQVLLNMLEEDAGGPFGEELGGEEAAVEPEGGEGSGAGGEGGR